MDKIINEAQHEEIYYGIFSSWGDVTSQFSVDADEPDEVYLAQYSYEDYSGSALVAYRNGDKYYTVSGSHCSCYGLEEQWDPEEYDKRTFLQMIDRRLDGGNEETKELWNKIKEKVEAND